MTTMASQINSLTVVYSTVYSDADQRKHESSASLDLCGEFTGTDEFPAQRASYAENVSIWWRHHVEEYLRLHWRGYGRDNLFITKNGFHFVEEYWFCTNVVSFFVETNVLMYIDNKILRCLRI